MSFRHAAPLLAAIALFACSSSTPAPEPTETPSEAPVTKTAADLALIAQAQAEPELVDKVKLLTDAQWQGGDFAQATVAHGEHGNDVVLRFTHGDANVDLLYTKDETGGPMALFRPLDANSRKVLDDSISEDDQGEGMSEADLAALPLDSSPEEVFDPPSKLELGAETTESTGPCGALLPGHTLKSGQKLWSCKNGYALYMQPDGNLVLYAPGSKATWSTKTNGKGGYKAVMQNDGNFVVYNKSGKALWASGHRHSGDQINLQDDGNLVKNTCGQVSWSSGTYCESGCVGVCKRWSCEYISKQGWHYSCIAGEENPIGLYHIETTRWGRTIEGVCGEGVYRNYRGGAETCPRSHYLSVFVCN